MNPEVNSEPKARVSTGPRTPVGKARSSQNARKHGLSAREVRIAQDEREEFDDFLACFLDDLQPQGMLEQDLFNQLVHAAWNLRRYEAHQDPLNGYAAEVSLLNRYHARAERTYHRCLKELKALQTNRALRQDLAAVHPDRPEPPPLTVIAEWTKRTPCPPRPGLLDGEEVIWHCYPGPPGSKEAASMPLEAA